MVGTGQSCWKDEATLEGLGKGSRVWYRAGPRSWQLGTVQRLGEGECSVALDSSLGAGAGQVVDASTCDVMPANPAMLDDVPDLTNLSFLNEPSILGVLERRYESDAIYTHAGPVLVAINPFKPVGLYTPEHVARYVSRPAAGAPAEAAADEPHIFLTADKAYKQASGLFSSLLNTI
jgi:myosin heavy subunit